MEISCEARRRDVLPLSRARSRAEAELDGLDEELLEPYRILAEPGYPLAPIARCILDSLPPREALLEMRKLAASSPVAHVALRLLEQPRREWKGLLRPIEADRENPAAPWARRILEAPKNEWPRMLQADANTPVTSLFGALQILRRWTADETRSRFGWIILLDFIRVHHLVFPVNTTRRRQLAELGFGEQIAALNLGKRQRRRAVAILMRSDRRWRFKIPRNAEIETDEIDGAIFEAERATREFRDEVVVPNFEAVEAKLRRRFRNAVQERLSDRIFPDRRRKAELEPFDECGMWRQTGAEAEAFLIADSSRNAGLTAAEERVWDLHLDGYSASEIAGQERCSCATVYVHLHNARRKIQKAI